MISGKKTLKAKRIKRLEVATSEPKRTFLKAFLVGALALFSFYFLTLLATTGDINHPLTQFRLLNPWISILIAGFGVQVGIFWLLRKGFRLNIVEKKELGMTSATGMTISGFSMVACCAHHVLEVLPILGLTGAALFLSDYQIEFLQIGVAANILGIIFMLWVLTGKKNLFSLIKVR